MAFYDIAAGQVLTDPVESFYRGKALRAGIKAQELQNEYAPAEQDRAERSLQVQRDQETRLADQEARLAEAQQMEIDSKAQQAAQDAIGQAAAMSVQVGRLGGSPEERFSAFERVISEKFGDKAPVIMEKFDRDGGGFSPDESRELEAFALSSGYIDPADDGQEQTLTALQKQVEPLVERDVISRERADEIYLQASERQGQASQVLTPGRVVAPILQKMANGEELTEGEQLALDTYQKSDPFEKLLQLFLPSIARELSEQ